MVPWVGRQCVIVVHVFSDYTNLLFVRIYYRYQAVNYSVSFEFYLFLVLFVNFVLIPNPCSKMQGCRCVCISEPTLLSCRSQTYNCKKGTG